MENQLKCSSLTGDIFTSKVGLLPKKMPIFFDVDSGTIESGSAHARSRHWVCKYEIPPDAKESANMKKTIFLTSLIMIILQIARSIIQNDSPTVNDMLELPLGGRLPGEYSSLLPEGYTIPVKLPKTIDGPHLLAAWVYLYNQTDSITIHDGSRLTGRSLAEMVIQHKVPVLWGNEDICHDNSCAKRYMCKTMGCVDSYSPDKVYPIYIARRYQDAEAYPLARLAASLAHELYHHSQPFGPVESSQYEEYWAYYVGIQIEQSKVAIFDRYPPTVSACLKAWFRVHDLKDYLSLEAYPITLDIPVDTTSEVCTP
jgi:hypothetical protein